MARSKSPEIDAAHVASVVEHKVVRRSREEAYALRDRSKLPPELEALARGEKRPFAKASGPRLQDPRVQAQVRGVKNQDARDVFQKRVATLKTAAREERARLWQEAELLELWRAGSLSGASALAHIVGHEPKNEAMEPLPEFSRAAWYRAEHAFLAEDAQVRVQRNRMTIDFPLSAEGADALVDCARSLALLFAAPPAAREDRESQSREPSDYARGRQDDARGRAPAARSNPRGGASDRGSRTQARGVRCDGAGAPRTDSRGLSGLRSESRQASPFVRDDQRDRGAGPQRSAGRPEREGSAAPGKGNIERDRGPGRPRGPRR